uniref:PE-PGRS family protein n=1 Tax=Parastrongyloides trichosuri TaxID=131310 RepID=A0A0N4Z7G3_PARTI
MRTAHPHRPRHGAIGVAPAIAVQPIAARAITVRRIAVGTVAIAPGRVLGLADAQVQRAVFAQRHGDGGGEVAIAARADPGADFAVHLAGRGLFPGVGPLLDRTRIRLAFSDPAGNLFFSAQAVRRRRLQRHSRRGLAHGLGQRGRAGGRHGARARARSGRNHALGIAARQQEGGRHESGGPIAAPQRIGQGRAFSHEAQRDGVDAVAQTRGRRPVREDVALMAVAAGAACLDAHHAVAVVAHGANMGRIDRLGEAGPAGAAFELGSRPEQRQAAFATAEHPCPLFTQQGPAERRLGAVRQKHALLFRQQVGLQRHALAVGRGRQVIAGRGTHGGLRFSLGHGLKIGRAGRSFHRPALDRLI